MTRLALFLLGLIVAWTLRRHLQAWGARLLGEALGGEFQYV